MSTSKPSGHRSPSAGKKKPKPAAPAAPPAGAIAGNIQHFVVLMMENRSFDHLFGYR